MGNIWTVYYVLPFRNLQNAIFPLVIILPIQHTRIAFSIFCSKRNFFCIFATMCEEHGRKVEYLESDNAIKFNEGCLFIVMEGSSYLYADHDMQYNIIMMMSKVENILARIFCHIFYWEIFKRVFHEVWI